MRLGGPVFGKFENASQWAAAHKEMGYRATYCPVNNTDSDDVIREYVKAVKENDLIIAEVGAWNNPLVDDPAKRQEANLYNQKQLELAERIGARCCVNIAGSRGEQWDGPHPDNFSQDTFDLIVETVRTIIDAVKPKNAFYTLEPMPWIFPHTADAYLDLLKAIDRKQFAVHLDPINMVASPWIYYHSGDFLREFFSKLGPYIKSCHAKDIKLSGKLTVHLDEVRPGAGEFDYRTYLRELSKIDPDTPLMIEHLSDPEDYRKSAEYIQSVAKNLGISL